MEFSILGPLEVRDEGSVIRIPPGRQRALLVLLLAEFGRTVSTERLIDQLWQGQPPPQAAVTLRSYVSSLRSALHRPGAGPVLVTRGHGYAVELGPHSVDAVRLDQQVVQGYEQMRAGDPTGALATFTDAVGLWRGQPLAEVADHATMQGLVGRLTELYLAASEGRLQALLGTGRHVQALPELEAFVTDHPLREQPRALQMLALYRAGRAPEALEAHDRFSRLLDDELGLEPSAALADLRQRILLQAPDLDLPPEPLSSRSAGPVSEVADEAVPSSRVVGREGELRRARQHLDRLLSKQGGLVLLKGEAGIGKTTLLDQFDALATSAALPVHWGRAPSARGAPAFWPWIQVLRSLADGLEAERLARAAAGPAEPVSQLVPELAQRLGHERTNPADPQLARFLLYEAVATFLHQALDGPAVILLDDLHWADVPSLELLSYLTPRLAGWQILLVASYRDLDSERSTALDETLATVAREELVEEIALRGLPHAAVAALAELVTTRPVPEHLVTLLHERTAGNPFFVRQLAQLVLDSPGDPGLTASAGVPVGLQQVLAQRRDGLPPQARRLVELAAVIGRQFDLRVLAAAADISVEDALDITDEIVRHGLIATGDAMRYRFVHSLVQEVVYADLPPGRRVKLHARVATALEIVGAPVDQLAEHMWLGSQLLPQDAPLRYSLAAAEQAVKLLAYEQAETYLRRALHLAADALPPDPHAELEVLLRLFQLTATNRGWGAPEADEVLQRARELADAGALHRDLVHLWWSLWTWLRTGRQMVASNEIGAAWFAQAARSRDPVSLAVGHLMLAFAHFDDPDGEQQGREELRRSRAAVDEASSDELIAFPENLDVMVGLTESQAAIFVGDPAARTLLRSALDTAERDGRPFPRAVARSFAAMHSAFLPDPAHTLELAVSALELDEQFGFQWLEILATVSHAWAS
ncbi:MAG TPA: BTAD domain-containing putative transcriptional regulator, partial [Propionibacteriaceae bacterium]